MDFSTYARRFVGVKEGSKEHHAIIDSYNRIRPLPRGYKVKYTDAWCATFVSFVMKECGAINPPYECGVADMYAKALHNHQAVTEPRKNDFVVYDWGHNGSLDHIGIIESISGSTMTVIEGNKNDAVGVRVISRYNPAVVKFIRVKQKTQPTKNNYDKVIDDVIKGKYGNGTARKEALEKAGYNYATVQKLVNQRLKG